MGLCTTLCTLTDHGVVHCHNSTSTSADLVPAAHLLVPDAEEVAKCVKLIEPVLGIAICRAIDVADDHLYVLWCRAQCDQLLANILQAQVGWLLHTMQ